AVALILATLAVAWIETRWLLASLAYAEGTRRAFAGRLPEAYAEFRRAATLAPWLPLPAESAAYAALRLAEAVSDPGRRLSLLGEGEAILAEARRHAASGAGSWALTAQLAFAQARAGDRSKLPVSVAAFSAAAAMRPRDAELLAQWGWAWLE